LRRESRAGLDGRPVRDGKTSQMGSKKGRREEEVRDNQEKKA
jgi:hypothetical protein